MAQPYRLQATGLAELAHALRQAPSRMDRELRKANKEAVEKAVVPPVRRGAPKRSGRLAQSVRALATAKRAQLAVGTSAKVPYAGPINFGWPARGIKAQEFIYRGIVQSRDQIIEVYVQHLDRVAEHIAPAGRL